MNPGPGSSYLCVFPLILSSQYVDKSSPHINKLLSGQMNEDKGLFIVYVERTQQIHSFTSLPFSLLSQVSQDPL